MYAYKQNEISSVEIPNAKYAGKLMKTSFEPKTHYFILSVNKMMIETWQEFPFKIML